MAEMDFDPVFLSRLQFAWVIGWHILLPAFTVGAAAFIAVLEGFSLATRRERSFHNRPLRESINPTLQSEWCVLEFEKRRSERRAHGNST
jgi:hypothetical protein